MVEHSKWRFYSRVVAWIDLVITALTLLGLFIICVVVLPSLDEIQGMEQDGILRRLIIVVVLLAFAMQIVFLVLAVLLYRATDEGKETNYCVKMAGRWRIGQITILVLSVLAMFHGTYRESIPNIILRPPMIYVVSMYIKGFGSGSGIAGEP